MAARLSWRAVGGVKDNSGLSIDKIKDNTRLFVNDCKRLNNKFGIFIVFIGEK
jgi:hypothetical protein